MCNMKRVRLFLQTATPIANEITFSFTPFSGQETFLRRLSTRPFCISVQYFKSNHGAYFTGDVAQERVRALTLARVLLQQPPNTHSAQCWKQVGGDRDFSAAAALYMRVP